MFDAKPLEPGALIRRVKKQGHTAAHRQMRAREKQQERGGRTGPINLERVSIVGGGADHPHEVAFQAVILLDDTALGVNKGRWKVSLPDDAGVVTIFKHRATCGKDANTNVTANAVFDVNLNGVSQGTVTIANGTASGDADVADYTVSDADRITIDHDAGNDEGDVFQVILIGKQQVRAGIVS